MRQEAAYLAAKIICEEKHISISRICSIAGISRSSYYKWLNREVPEEELLNEAIADAIRDIHRESPDKGYRRIRDDLFRDYGFCVNDKRILRICRILGVKSTIKYERNSCTVNAACPQHISENILNRNFSADAPNQKWLTDVTEFKYYVNGEKKKVYLSAILDLYDRRIVSHVISDHNDNLIVFDTFDKAVQLYPEAHPLFHSDRGFQYTNAMFHDMLEDHGMMQSMSRVGKCIDNGPMEGFWGILKRERYYGRRFESREKVIDMIEDYIDYYNNRRYQRRLGIVTPIEKYTQYLFAA